ncbi:MAG: homoserine dehydrogenase [Actinomycetota bacterium]|nr:homoserine dehydrogenase [Actinomycetota bacterium]
MSESIRVGFLGCGVVGGAAARIIADHARALEERCGARIEIERIAVRSLSKERAVDLPEQLFTTDPWEVVGDPSIHIVVEVIGGVEPALDLVLEAIKNGKHIVTANKELISTMGRDIVEAAGGAGVDVLFEAAVGGGIPVLRPIKESLAGDRIRRVMGIVNGTTNYILTRMSERGEGFAQALGEAETLGYTELDPSADIEGFDAAQKTAIVASIAFNLIVVAGDVHREGIARVSATDVAAAHELGYEIKLLAVAEVKDGRIATRVHPAMIPRTHPLASVRGVFNAVFVEAEEAGELMFFGRGAGGGPTGSAIVGDVAEVARHIISGGTSIGWTHRERARITPQDDIEVRYYVVLSVLDRIGVLSTVAGVFARHGVSIASVRQEGSGDEASLALITHAGTEGQHGTTFRELQALDVVRAIKSRIRVMGTEEL